MISLPQGLHSGIAFVWVKDQLGVSVTRSPSPYLQCYQIPFTFPPVLPDPIHLPSSVTRSHSPSLQCYQIPFPFPPVLPDSISLPPVLPDPIPLPPVLPDPLPLFSSVTRSHSPSLQCYQIPFPSPPVLPDSIPLPPVLPDDDDDD
ncbi:hypothetical protein Pcinc_027104 [Petrolisthes cinctipes]|uniref:Uncharacterized protein n=1 Tax=Petrolisthes cinctipes TaxID=88211 RepID=A0AAE1F654_PETCI|nr:hypothetical protein Pcinc_027104 [Petrolisthes cinctipes]